ncbi:hypothetical protein ACLMJK_006164 [Lecanora helva]
MGWFWNKTPSSDSSNDPLRDLDPSLRDFLDKESPVKYKPAPPPPSSPQPPTTSTTSPPPTTTPPVPPESLYPDGRYAHLWSTYKPLAQIEAESKTDQEKLSDVLDGYKARKAQIGRAAVENCVFEQMKIDECFDSGGIFDRFRMCHAEHKGFERCYTMQSRFLKALGYLSTYDRPPEIEEQIQMHADTLYHRMLAQEKAAEEAKAAGQPVPQFEPILTPEAGTNVPTIPSNVNVPPHTPGNNTTMSSETQSEGLPTLSPVTQSLLNQEAQLKLQEYMKKLTPIERELHERSVQAEARNAQEIAARVKLVDEGRKKRREEGKATTGDTISGWFGW